MVGRGTEQGSEVGEADKYGVQAKSIRSLRALYKRACCRDKEEDNGNGKLGRNEYGR